ncbi:ATP-grasp domain-containing protein [Actinokineospora sp. NPDC004072]
MDKQALLVVGSGLKVYREYLVTSAAARARAAGVELVLVNNLHPTWQHDHFAEITVANIFDHDVLRAEARAAARRWSVVGVLCWDEPLVMPAAELAAEFGVPGLGVAGVRGCRDKKRTRTLLTDAGLPQPGHAMAASLGQARAAAAEIGYPVVVKPRALGASMGVVLVRDPSELDRAYQVAHEASLIGDAPYRGGAIVEGYADGPEISVDGAVHKGEYLPMFIARKQTGHAPYFEEVGHTVDGADPLLADAELLDTVARAHRELGVENGMTHTEVRLTARGPVIIEVNGRLGGDLIPYLGKLATGIDPGEVLVDVATGNRPDTAPTRAAVAGIRFGYPETDCVVRSVRVPRSAPGLVAAAPMVDPGTTLRLPPGGYIARHSFVVCSAADTATCEQRLAAAAAAVEVDAEPIAAKPAGAAFELPAGLLDADV